MVVTINGRRETLTAAAARDLMDQIIRQTPGELAAADARRAIRGLLGRDARDDDDDLHACEPTGGRQLGDPDVIGFDPHPGPNGLTPIPDQTDQPVPLRQVYKHYPCSAVSQ